MAESMEQPGREKLSTYVVQNRNNEKELQRLAVQDRMMTASMGGVLPEQVDPTAFRYVLDIGSGSGSWVIEAAQTYPHMQLVGIDISPPMVKYAQAQAAISQVADRVTFQVMDALQTLEFPDSAFDLVNIRLGSNFVRKFEWHQMVEDMLRITCAGGVIRIVEVELGGHSTSAALDRWWAMFVCAMYEAMRTFELKPGGLTDHLAELLALHGYGCEQIQIKMQPVEFRGGMSEGHPYYDNIEYLSQTLRPFIQKYGCFDKDYDVICQQMRKEMQEADFRVNWSIWTAWGRKPE